ncbi:hypothetical protein FC83_GL000733 [Agrilactobacillus composti DSM 18527 = JCM 14202]|uniref:Putative host cell surface-exposed lipoprotein Ltp-like HTH region domain-containing protein n=1 Tax=Agrilactobacillus composti DSM 18527 = JCM 14202 TaxID=1423734 RepID=A0A0R1XMF5_9LACO|nr:Ltp family lipoprotein [Agrilactobacillus composti]KRM31440.1 hypothetical protein FC83_GL000733 [Agrilactobacillus composti DSM 18527 = JCM 14202]
MKKRHLLSLVLLLIFPVVLLSCASSQAMSKDQLETSFNNISSTVISNLKLTNSADYSHAKMVTQAKKGINRLNAEEAKLNNNHREPDLTKALQNYAAVSRDYLNSVQTKNVKAQQVTAFFQTTNQIARDHFAGDNPQAIKAYNNWAHTNNMADMTTYLQANDPDTAITAAKATPLANAQSNAVPAEYKTALFKAATYSRVLHKSKQGIYDELTAVDGDHYTPQAAQYALANLEADYNANALAAAKYSQTALAMAPEEIRAHLLSAEGEKFTPSEVTYAMQRLNDYK